MRIILTIISNVALMLTMIISAHEVIDLPLGWKGAWYMVLFTVALQIWTIKNK